MVADKIMSSVPGKIASFPKEQTACILKGIHEIGTAYYYANRDSFSIYSNPDISLGAAFKMEKKQHTKSSSNPDLQKWKVIHGNIIECQYCKEEHVDKKCVMAILNDRNLCLKTLSTWQI